MLILRVTINKCDGRITLQQKERDDTVSKYDVRRFQMRETLHIKSELQYSADDYCEAYKQELLYTKKYLQRGKKCVPRDKCSRRKQIFPRPFFTPSFKLCEKKS